jgi:hypothetical protein
MAFVLSNCRSAANFHATAVSTSKWVIVGNPDADHPPDVGVGSRYVCSVANVAKEAGWKTIIIGDKLDCCRYNWNIYMKWKDF